MDLLLDDRTGIVIAHRLNTVQRADEIIILEDGRIREVGDRVPLAADTTRTSTISCRRGWKRCWRSGTENTMTATTQQAPLRSGKSRAGDMVLTTGPDDLATGDLQTWLSVGYLAIWIVVHIFELAPRVMSKLFFDTLTGDQPFRFGVTGIMILVLRDARFPHRHHRHRRSGGRGTEVHGRDPCCAGTCWRTSSIAPGPSAIAGSPGEALNTFRDDVDEIEQVLGWLADQIAIATYTLITLGLMLRINARIALLSLIPLVVVILVSRGMASRAERYRQAGRRATARVSGALTEVLGAVQAIKVAGAETHVATHVDALGKVRQHAMVRDRALNQVLHASVRRPAR